MNSATQTQSRPVRTQSRRATSTWPILMAAASVGLIFLGVGFQDLGSHDRLLLINRYLARLSFLFFIPIYAAAPLAIWRPGAATRGLIRIRRSLGLGYALVMATHLGAILAYQQTTGSEPLDLPTLLGGGLGFAFIAALALTSNDLSIRKMGGRAWKRLHRTALHWLWVIYALTYSGRVSEDGFEYLPALVTVFLLLGLRLSVRFQRAA